MANLMQFLLISSVTLLTVVFVAAGIWLMLVFRDLRRLLRQWEIITRRADKSLAALESGISGLPVLLRELRDSARILAVLKLVAGWGEQLLAPKKKGARLFAREKTGQAKQKAQKILPPIKKVSHRFFLKKK